MIHHHTNSSQLPVKMAFIEPDQACWLSMEKAMKHCLPIITPFRLASTQQAMDQFTTWELQEWDLPKLIFMELYLPSLEDGCQLLQYLKTMSTAIRQIPIIVLTHSAATQNVDTAYELGACSYLTKPQTFTDWLACFTEIRTYWLETVNLLPLRF